MGKLTKLNSFFYSLAAGESVLFKRGETFSGAITVNQSGSAGNPIVISAYGTGANPVISGFTQVSTLILSQVLIMDDIYCQLQLLKRKILN